MEQTAKKICEKYLSNRERKDEKIKAENGMKRDKRKTVSGMNVKSANSHMQSNILSIKSHESQIKSTCQCINTKGKSKVFLSL